MEINYNNRKFKPISNASNGEVTSEMVFHYKQIDDVISCSYSGDNILSGNLLGTVSANGEIKMSYHQINKKGELMTGICHSKPEILESGLIRLHEDWQWTSGDKSKGKSVLQEI